MKRILITLALSTLFTFISLSPHGLLLNGISSPFSILNPQSRLIALGADNQESISFTVVIPPNQTLPIDPEPVIEPQINYLYPVSVVETQEQGKKMIIKTYELSFNESPENISRESFARSNWWYELADITKVENASLNQREHTETVTVNSGTREMETILSLLPTTKDFESEDGYIGNLSLDISSIQIDSAGTRSSSYAVTATREYPHLSSNDVSLVPKSINDNGRTLTLSGVQWRSQNTTAIDHNPVPNGYTAIATYTGSASRTTVTGYNITATYSGTIAKITTEKTIYTAYFIGVPIITPLMSQMPADLSEEAEVILTEGELAANEGHIVGLDSQDQKPDINWPMLLLILAFGINSGLLLYYIKTKQKIMDYTTGNTYNGKENETHEKNANNSVDVDPGSDAEPE